MSGRLWISVAVGSILTLAFLTAGCGESANPPGSTASATPNPTPTLVPLPTTVPIATAVPTPTSLPESDEGEGHQIDLDPVARGRNVYVSAGCGGCHGEDALGSEIAPGLAGHTELQIRRQVRGPIGIMPVFGPAALSSDELGDLFAYAMSLESEHKHDAHGSGPSGAEQSMSHHRMALMALEAGELSEATHHVRHLFDLLEGPHLSAMEEALAALESGEVHEGQHQIEAMLADIAAPAETLPQLHLKLALSAIRVAGAEGAAHHLEHTIGLVSDHESTVIGQARDLIAGSEFELAEQLIAGMLGVEALGTEGDGHDDHTHDAAIETEMGSGDTAQPPDIDPSLIPVLEAYEAVQTGDTAMAAHHLGEFMEQASGIERIKAREALELLEKADLHEAEHAIGELLSIGAHID